MSALLLVDIGTIKIICKPCKKCRAAEDIIKKALHELEVKFKVKYTYKLKKVADLSEGRRYSANISKIPFVVVDRQLIFAGRLTDVDATKNTFLDLIKNRGMRH